MGKPVFTPEETARILDGCRGALAHLRTSEAAARRRHPPDQDDDGWREGFGSPYDADTGKFLCSKAIRRSPHKAQVIVLSRNSHTRNRLTHTFEVIDIGVAAGEILGLNVELLRAGLLGHDIGHTPHGHQGESFLAKVTGKPFRHEVFGVVVAQKIERRGRGLNLTHQTLRVIRNHSRGAGDLHTEGLSGEEALGMYADKIAYIFADYNDLFSRTSLTGTRFRIEDYPRIGGLTDWFGATHRERVKTCILALCAESAEAGSVSFSASEVAGRFAELKTEMYSVYGLAKPQCAESSLELVYEYLQKACPDADPALIFALLNDDDVSWIVKRAGDGSLTNEDFERLSVSEIACSLKGREIDITDPDLDW